jgi:signal transduction histidine kinase
MKIKIKLLASVFILILITGAVIIMVSQLASKNMVENQIYNRLETTAESRANHIETILNEYEELAETLAAGNSFRDVVDESKDDTQTLEQAHRRIESIIQSHDEISRIRILDKNGMVIASSYTDVGVDESTDDLFLKGEKGVYAGELHSSKFSGKIVMSVAAPILVNGEFSGVTVLNFDMEKELFDITTNRTGLGETGEAYLLNKDGYMISPSMFVNDTFMRQKVDTGDTRNWFRRIEIFGAPEHKEVASLYKNYRGRDVLGVHAYIPEMDWCLVAEMGEEEAFSSLAELKQRMLSLLTLLLVVGMLLFTVLSGTLIKPIVKLHNGTEEIMKGNLDYKVGTKARDEIGELSRAFDKMTSNLKKSKEELEEYSKGLEKNVEERTRELDEKMRESEEQKIATLNMLEDIKETKKELERAKEELEETNRKLERSNKELQEFVYVASHDLKEPVRKVSAFGELMKETLAGRLDEDEQENFDFMIDGATRMQQMIDDLLIYSRVTTKAKPAEPVDVNAVIENLKNVELAVPLEEVGGDIEVPKPLPNVYADSSQMHQLLQNLIGNGLKYHRDGVPPVVTVRSKQNGNKVRIEVQDNGIGISEEYYEEIFKMFQRLHSADDYEGTGIGLAVCKKIVERHGGEIGIESTPDAGSRFWFTVPGGEMSAES